MREEWEREQGRTPGMRWPALMIQGLAGDRAGCRKTSVRALIAG